MESLIRIEKAARAAVEHAWIEESAAFTEWNQFHSVRTAVLRALKRDLGIQGRAPASVFNAVEKYARQSVFEMVYSDGKIQLNCAGAGKKLAPKIRRFKRRVKKGTLNVS